MLMTDWLGSLDSSRSLQMSSVFSFVISLCVIHQMWKNSLSKTLHGASKRDLRENEVPCKDGQEDAAGKGTKQIWYFFNIIFHSVTKKHLTYLCSLQTTIEHLGHYITSPTTASEGHYSTSPTAGRLRIFTPGTSTRVMLDLFYIILNTLSFWTLWTICRLLSWNLESMCGAEFHSN
jgi:hypothetical protein